MFEYIELDGNSEQDYVSGPIIFKALPGACDDYCIDEAVSYSMLHKINTVIIHNDRKIRIYPKEAYAKVVILLRSSDDNS